MKFKFITKTSTYSPTHEDRREVKSHVSRGRPRRKQHHETKSWIMRQDGKSIKSDDMKISIPSRVGSDISLIDFPEILKPYMEEDLLKSYTFMKGALYPAEICLPVDVKQSSWMTSLLIDVVYFHSALFSIEAYFDMFLKREQSSLTQYHFSKTLRLLQERLNAPHNAKTISDPTIMVVITLGLTAELIGDRLAAENHMEGLRKIIELRGGLDKLDEDNPRLPAKICRVDLGLALRFGCKPVFFRDSISWGAYLAQNKIQTKKDSVENIDTVMPFIQTLNQKLVNVWKDLKEFSRLANLAAQTSYKFPPNTFSEIMVSILYRLLSLSFPESPMEEAIRLGMMSYAAAVFFRWRTMRQRQGHLDHIFDSALKAVRKSSLPLPVTFWLVMIRHTCTSNGSHGEFHTSWLGEVMAQLSIHDDEQARQVLKSVMWIDCLFDVRSAVIWSHPKTRKSQMSSILGFEEA